VTQAQEKLDKERLGGSRSANATTGQNGLTRAKEVLARVCQEFRAFLEECSQFYQALIQQLQTTYQLNLQYPTVDGSVVLFAIYCFLFLFYH
jgi:hypothetical protein